MKEASGKKEEEEEEGEEEASKQGREGGEGGKERDRRKVSSRVYARDASNLFAVLDESRWPSPSS